MPDKSNQEADLKRIIESATRLGVEMDEAEALQWLTQMAAGQTATVELDAHSGVFGHRTVLLDFNPAQLEHFRTIGRLVEFGDVPGKVETALALSGSAAQSKIQTYPGDADFFERVNILAPSRNQACQILADIMRAKALQTFKGENYQLIEVKMGNYPYEVLRGSKPMKAGSPVSWSAAETQAGRLEVSRPDGSPVTLLWDDIALDPGWCKLDWVVADAQRGELVNASNMLDVTWEAPDGTITALDGYLDPYFQEVYLEAQSVPIFSKLAKHVSGNALDDYVEALEKEIHKYLTKDLNYGKAAKRMYNVFRLTGRYPEAAFLRELFDEPTTVLYQIWSLIRTIDDCFAPNSTFSKTELLGQFDRLILLVVDALEGDRESEIVRLLMRLRGVLQELPTGQGLSTQAEAARSEVINIVNNFFREKLIGMPVIKEYMEELAKK